MVELNIKRFEDLSDDELDNEVRWWKNKMDKHPSTYNFYMHKKLASLQKERVCQKTQTE